MYRTKLIIFLSLGFFPSQKMLHATDYSMWPATQFSDTYVTENRPVELGLRFISTVSGSVTAIRFYKGPKNTGTHTGSLWSASGQLLRKVTFTNETATGWQQAKLATPVAITANTIYTVSYFAPAGGYSYSTNYFTSQYSYGILKSAPGNNGVYVYGSAGGYPTQMYNYQNYWVDVVVTTPTTPPANGIYTLFSSTDKPLIEASTDTQPVELGVRFSSTSDAFVTGIRFYQGPGNSGIHTGSLWSADGERIATVTFPNDTTVGWKQANFPKRTAITKDTPYVISYFAPHGAYSLNQQYFINSYLSGILTAPPGTNGVFRYGSTSAFPEDTYQSSNYWVDAVVTKTSTSGDATLPAVSITAPSAGASVSRTVTITANASDNLGIAGVQFFVDGSPDGPEDLFAPYTHAWDTTELANGTHTISAKARDTSNNTKMSTVISVTVSNADFTLGPGGPILVIKQAANPFSSFISEIIRTEGFNEFTVSSIENVTASKLSAYNVVILGDIPLTTTHVTLFTNWVNAGGNLIAMHPDPKLNPLLGITSAGTLDLPDAYLRVNTATASGKGITGLTIQYHGSAREYHANAGTSVVATLWSTRTAATTFPAVTLANVGSNGGQAASFAFDLARSTVYTREGNPAYSGQERDGISPMRPDDLYYPDYVDFNNIAIPQADELQRLLANLIIQMSNDKKPLPRFWYFPNMLKAVLVMVGDDHGTSDGTKTFFDELLANSPAGCTVANWTCFRATSLLYPYSGLQATDATRYNSLGFGLGVHVSTGCGDWTPASLDATFDNDLYNFGLRYPDLPSQKTSRTHCTAYSDYDTTPQVEKAHGIRMDFNYYFWPGSWIQNRPGYFTGSGIPMRYATRNGTTLDVFQVPSVLVDENELTYPGAINTMITRATGSLGYYGAIGTHYGYTSPLSSQLITSAKTYHVPLVSGEQLLTWMDGRNASKFSGITWNGTTLQFTVTVGTGAANIYAMVPAVGRTVKTITRSGVAVPFTVSTIKGISYALFKPVSGAYVVTY